LPEASDDFEAISSEIVEIIRMNDQRFGVEPKNGSKKAQAIMRIIHCTQKLLKELDVPIIEPDMTP